MNLHLPNLTHLKVKAVDVYNTPDLTRLPKLSSFSIDFSIFGDGDISELIGPLGHPGITSLDLACTHDSAKIGGRVPASLNLVSLFPSVMELKLILVVKIGAGPDQDFLALTAMLQSLRDWDLAEGQVDIHHDGSDSISEFYRGVFYSRVVIAVLEGLAGWKGLNAI